jgi:hypothetical protein
VLAASLAARKKILWERLLEIRVELGYSQTLYLNSSQELTDIFDAYGFDAYAFSSGNKKFNYGDYRTQVAPGGDHVRSLMKAH